MWQGKRARDAGHWDKRYITLAARSKTLLGLAFRLYES